MEWIFSSVCEIPGLYFCSALTSGYVLYYLLEVVKKPIIACSDGEFKNFLTANVPLLGEKFWPTVWCVESRLQTLMASFVRATSIPQVNYRREILTLSDGGQICLDWMEPIENCPPDTPTIIILPGLTGASKADYVRGLVLAAKDEGLRSVVFNQRGIGGIKLKTPRTYCAANFDDLVEVIAYVRGCCPNAPVAATGISMGGLILGNYISTHEDAGKSLTAAMLISVPWNVFKGCDSIERPVVNLLLNRHLASCLCNIIRGVREVVEPDIGASTVDNILKSKTIKEFDSLYTCKQFGYGTVEAYYSAATIHNKVHRMKVPTLCLNAADDPFQPYDGIPVEEVNKSHNVCVVITPRGGHIGFMEGIWPLISIGRRQYMFELFAQYFRSALSQSEDFSAATEKVRVSTP
ncbi:hypothetical protein GE061_002916 [Apolygus lucorum]|uniref:AB hydrolase-1 domain-containing protein n=1 Tax=Apolygus lucorum TaxID=248454 RepID=A0A6A4JDD5_APOLU|nr:hypothetical protein GE061_002916 [Apolygus lucorum]